MASRAEIEYASELTETVLQPEKPLETFGVTAVGYYVVTELLDTVGRVRIREGRFHVERPQVITPSYFASQLVENFGEEARTYAERFAKSPEGLRILQYGLQFRKEENRQSVVPGNLDDVAHEIARDLRSREDAFSGVVIGVDDLWEVSLLRFGIELIGASAPKHVRDLAGEGLLDPTRNGVPAAVREELESDFIQAAGDRDSIHALGNKLRKYGLLSEYEDRLYELIRKLP